MNNEVISPDGKWIVLWSGTGGIVIFDVATSKFAPVDIANNYPTTQDLKISPDSMTAWRLAGEGGNILQSISLATAKVTKNDPIP